MKTTPTFRSIHPFGQCRACGCDLGYSEPGICRLCEAEQNSQQRSVEKCHALGGVLLTIAFALCGVALVLAIVGPWLASICLSALATALVVTADTMKERDSS